MISAYMLNASGELTTGDIAGIMGTIEPDSYGIAFAPRKNLPFALREVLVTSLRTTLVRMVASAAATTL